MVTTACPTAIARAVDCNAYPSLEMSTYEKKKSHKLEEIQTIPFSQISIWHTEVIQSTSAGLLLVCDMPQANLRQEWAFLYLPGPLTCVQGFQKDRMAPRPCSRRSFGRVLDVGDQHQQIGGRPGFLADKSTRNEVAGWIGGRCEILQIPTCSA